MILAAHGEAESAGFFENFRVGYRTLAHSAEVMRLPLPLRWAICTLGAVRKRLSNRPGSPHNAWTRAQATALARKLEQVWTGPVTVRAAFASSDPSVETLIAQASDAHHRVVLSMSPSDSRLSCGLLCHALMRSPAEGRRTQVLARLWADPDFAALNAGHVRTACAAQMAEGNPLKTSKTVLILVFHGTLIRDQRGLAPAFHTGGAEKSRFAEALQAALSTHSDSPWSEVAIAYLNHNVAGTWSQPSVGAALNALKARGFESAWVFPCDFPVEGGEISGSLARQLATGTIRDARLLPCLNDSPRFIDYLAERVLMALSERQRSWTCDACPRPGHRRSSV